MSFIQMRHKCGHHETINLAYDLAAPLVTDLKSRLARQKCLRCQCPNVARMSVPPLRGNSLDVAKIDAIRRSTLRFMEDELTALRITRMLWDGRIGELGQRKSRRIERRAYEALHLFRGVSDPEIWLDMSSVSPRVLFSHVVKALDTETHKRATMPNRLLGLLREAGG